MSEPGNSIFEHRVEEVMLEGQEYQQLLRYCFALEEREYRRQNNLNCLSWVYMIFSVAYLSPNSRFYYSH